MQHIEKGESEAVLHLGDVLQRQGGLVELAVVDPLGEDAIDQMARSWTGLAARSEREAASTPSASEITALSRNCGRGPS